MLMLTLTTHALAQELIATRGAHRTVLTEWADVEDGFVEDIVEPVTQERSARPSGVDVGFVGSRGLIQSGQYRMDEQFIGCGPEPLPALTANVDLGRRTLSLECTSQVMSVEVVFHGLEADLSAQTATCGTSLLIPDGARRASIEHTETWETERQIIPLLPRPRFQASLPSDPEPLLRGTTP